MPFLLRWLARVVLWSTIPGLLMVLSAAGRRIVAENEARVSRDEELLRNPTPWGFYLRYYADHEAPGEALPGLYRVLTQHGYRAAPYRAILDTQPPASEWEFWDQLCAGAALARLGAVEVLEGVLRSHPDPPTRWVAARSLGRVEPPPTRTLPTLVGALRDDSALVQRGAVWALGRLGPPALPALAEMMPLLNHREMDVRSRAETAVIRVTAGNFDALVRALDKTPVDDPQSRSRLLSTGDWLPYLRHDPDRLVIDPDLPRRQPPRPSVRLRGVIGAQRRHGPPREGEP